MVLAMISVNIIAVVICGIMSMGLGMLWYGPLFGKQWMKLIGMKEPTEKEKKDMMDKMMPAMLAGFIAALVTAYILGALIKMVGASGIEGSAIGVIVWLGFLATSTLNSVLWEGKSANLYVLNNGHLLVNLILVGAVMGSM